jgi:hypothetical protein
MGNSGAGVGTLVSANLNCGVLTLGTSGTSGVLTLGAGTHSIGAVAASGTGTANAITYGGKVTLGGNQTLNNITAVLGSAVLLSNGNYTINGATPKVAVANTNCDILGNGASKVITVSNLDMTGKPTLRVWNGIDGGGNTNVQVCPGPPELLEAA